jgi:hypothetical protein
MEGNDYLYLTVSIRDEITWVVFKGETNTSCREIVDKSVEWE